MFRECNIFKSLRIKYFKRGNFLNLYDSSAFLVQILNTLTVILKSSIKQALTTRAVVKQQKFHPNFMQCRNQPDYICPHTMIFNTLCTRTPTTPRNICEDLVQFDLQIS